MKGGTPGSPASRASSSSLSLWIIPSKLKEVLLSLCPLLHLGLLEIGEDVLRLFRLMCMITGKAKKPNELLCTTAISLCKALGKAIRSGNVNAKALRMKLFKIMQFSGRSMERLIAAIFNLPNLDPKEVNAMLML
mmetsp:Transcript_31964/g.54146  ORF Transcript_31964/g.54146 Transcript_31964/m.54146 type:complete len:135 (+) Transcript_31964:84-488(+)